MSGLGVRLEVRGLRELLPLMKQLGPETDKAFRLRLRAAVGVVVRDAQSRASWSRRIPRAVQASVTTRGVAAVLRARQAPHGVLYETRGAWRHPLFGDREHWYTQRGRPFLRPAAEAHYDDVRREAEAAFEDAKRGLHL